MTPQPQPSAEQALKCAEGFENHGFRHCGCAKAVAAAYRLKEQECQALIEELEAAGREIDARGRTIAASSEKIKALEAELDDHKRHAKLCPQHFQNKDAWVRQSDYDRLAEKLGLAVRLFEAMDRACESDFSEDRILDKVRTWIERGLKLSATEPDKPAAPAERPCHCEAIKADDEAPGCYSNCPNYKTAPAPSKEKP